jgi:hypothetical protein
MQAFFFLSKRRRYLVTHSAPFFGLFVLEEASPRFFFLSFGDLTGRFRFGPALLAQATRVDLIAVRRLEL